MLLESILAQNLTNMYFTILSVYDVHNKVRETFITCRMIGDLPGRTTMSRPSEMVVE